MNRLQQRKLQRREPDPNPNAMRGQVICSPTEPSGRSSCRGTSGRATLGRGTLGRGTSGRRTSGILSPPAHFPSSCCSTSTSDMFPPDSGSCRVRAPGRCFCGGTRPKNSSPLRVWVSGVRGRGRGSGVCSRGAGAGGCGRGVCSRISWPCSGSTVGWSSTMVSALSAGGFTISPWPIVWGSLPLS